MKSIPLIGLLLVLTVTSVFSQASQINKDYIVFNSDTLYGFIKTQNFELTPSNISFRKSESDSWVTYTAQDISSFSILGFHFDSRNLKIDFSSSKDSDIFTNSFQNIVIDTTVFVKVELKNDLISLYQHRDANNQAHYFVVKSSGVPEELLRKCSTVAQTISCKNIYWSTLRLFTNDCPSITDSEIKIVSLEASSLKRLLIRYIKCKNGKFEEEKKRGHSLISLFLAPGVTMLKFSGETMPTSSKHPGLVNADFGLTPTIQAGISYEYVPALNARFSLGADLGLRYYDAKVDYTTVNTTTNPLPITIRQVYDINPVYIKLSPSVKYLFSQTGLMPYARLGFSINYAVSFSSSYQITQKNGSNPETVTNSEGLTSNEFKNGEFSYYLGLGVKKSRVNLELRFEIGEGVLKNLPDVNSQTQTASLYLGYSLKKGK